MKIDDRETKRILQDDTFKMDDEQQKRLDFFLENLPEKEIQIEKESAFKKKMRRGKGWKLVFAMMATFRPASAVPASAEERPSVATNEWAPVPFSPNATVTGSKSRGEQTVPRRARTVALPTSLGALPCQARVNVTRSP